MYKNIGVVNRRVISVATLLCCSLQMYVASFK